MTLEEKLEEHWPPSRVIAECGECGGELFDTKKERPSTWSSGILSSLITMFALKHREESGHNDLQVNINSTTPVREIEATITVND
jgi:hypothetical protein